jgi:hypothetical protein
VLDMADESGVISRGYTASEPHLPVFPSFVWQGKRIRIVRSRIYYGDPAETFHEFLMKLVRVTFGQTWGKHQLKMSERDRHIVVNWHIETCELQQRQSSSANKESDGITYGADASGPVWALLTLGYDLFCLQANTVLPEFFVQRLRQHKDFQSVRYELAVAAVMARSGFEIDFLDGKERVLKHCEFIARHRSLPVVVGVEAKSRRRPGAIHEQGEFSYEEDARGIEKLIRAARKQKQKSVPFLIFVDVNVPASPEVLPEEKSWVKDWKKALSRLYPLAEGTAEPFNALFLTNFAYHFGDRYAKNPQPEWGVIASTLPEDRLDERVWPILFETLDRYGVIPRQV